MTETTNRTTLNGELVRGNVDYTLRMWHMHFRESIQKAKTGYIQRSNIHGSTEIPPVQTKEELTKFMRENGYRITYPAIFLKAHGEDLPLEESYHLGLKAAKDDTPCRIGDESRFGQPNEMATCQVKKTCEGNKADPNIIIINNVNEVVPVCKDCYETILIK